MKKALFGHSHNKKAILIIYDIADDRKRNKIAKIMEGYGHRIQKSAFEFFITDSQLNALLKGIDEYKDANNNIAVYSINKADLQSINLNNEENSNFFDVAIY